MNNIAIALTLDVRIASSDFGIGGNVRRIRRTIRKRIVICLVSILLVMLGLYSVYFFTKKFTTSLYGEKVSFLIEQLSNQERVVYVATRNISIGEKFTEENVVRKKVYSDEDVTHFIGEEIFSKQARIEIQEGMRIVTGMELEDVWEEDWKECTFTEIALTDTIKSGDVVDVRIQYPNGENYRVLVGKKLQRSETNALECRFLLSEQEQLYVSSALYDQTFYTGTKLYIVRYVAIPFENVCHINYIPTTAVLQQIYKTETERANKVQLRQALEQRLQGNYYKK